MPDDIAFSFLPLFACLHPAGCFVAHGSLQFSQSYVSTVWLDHKTVHVQRAGRAIWLRVVLLSTSFSLIFDADDSWMFDISVPAYLLNASGGYWLAEVWGYHRQLSSGVPTFRIMLAVYHSGWYHVRKIISLTVVCVLINSPAVSLPRGRQKTL